MDEISKEGLETEHKPDKSLFQQMREEPWMLAKVVAEWVIIGLLISCGLAILFLIVLGCHSLVVKAP